MPSGNNVGLCLLLIPIGSIVWVVQTGVVLPFDQARFLLLGGGLLTLPFVALWWAAFGRVWRDRRLIPMTLFLLCLWFGAGLFLVAKLNAALDFSMTPVLHYRKIVEARQISASRQCVVTLDQPIGAVHVAWLPASYCTGVQTHVDGLSLQLSPGALGMPWAKAYALVRDLDGFKARLGIP